MLKRHFRFLLRLVLLLVLARLQVFALVNALRISVFVVVEMRFHVSDGYLFKTATVFAFVMKSKIAFRKNVFFFGRNILLISVVGSVKRLIFQNFRALHIVDESRRSVLDRLQYAFVFVGIRGAFERSLDSKFLEFDAFECVSGRALDRL